MVVVGGDQDLLRSSLLENLLSGRRDCGIMLVGAEVNTLSVNKIWRKNAIWLVVIAVQRSSGSVMRLLMRT